MAKTERKKGRGYLITLIIVLLLVSIIWLIVLPFANKKAEKVLDKVVQDNLISTGYPLEYSKITVEFMKGQVGISQLHMPVGEDSFVIADELEVKVPLRKLIALVRQKGPSLITPTLRVKNLEYDDKELTVGAATAVVTLEIFLDHVLPEDAAVRKLHLNASEVRYATREGLLVSCQDIQLEVKGNMALATLQKDFDGMLDDLGYIDVKAIDGTILPDAETMSQLEMFALVSPWIADTDNWRFESLVVEARSLEQAVVLDSLALRAPLMEASGTATLPRGGSQAISMRLDVATLHSQVRTELAPIAQFMGQSIPPGTFEFDFAWNGTGLPDLTIY